MREGSNGRQFSMTLPVTQERDPLSPGTLLEVKVFALELQEWQLWAKLPNEVDTLSFENLGMKVNPEAGFQGASDGKLQFLLTALANKKKKGD